MIPIHDERGYLMKVSQSSLLPPDVRWKEVFYTFSRAGVLRGMHWQEGAIKLVHCVSGCILDVTMDPKTGKFKARDLTSGGQSVWIPAGLAHGFYSPVDSIVLYQMSDEYDPQKEGGVHWDSFGFDWPFMLPPIVSKRDANLPRFSGVDHSHED